LTFNDAMITWNASCRAACKRGPRGARVVVVVKESERERILWESPVCCAPEYFPYFSRMAETSKPEAPTVEPAPAAAEEEKKPAEEKPAEKPAESGAAPAASTTEESDDEEPPSLEAVDQTAAGAAAADAGAEEREAKQSRSEKKARKAMSKLGLKPVAGVIRVTMKRAKNTLFVVNRPDVFKSPIGDTYVVFGEAKVEDLGASAAMNRQFAEPAAAAAATAPAAAAAETTPAAAAPATAAAEAEPAATEEAAVDESGLNASDIELVMTQGKCSRSKAVEMLRKHNGDIVNAIMELGP